MLTKGEIYNIRISMYDGVESASISKLCEQAMLAIELQAENERLKARATK